jgi:DNA-directed RNA polymerase specialized sigma subunit
MLESLSTNESKILVMFYVDKKTMFEMSMEMGYTEKYMWRLKKEAIEKFAVSLFGIEALKDM